MWQLPRLRSKAVAAAALSRYASPMVTRRSLLLAASLAWSAPAGAEPTRIRMSELYDEAGGFSARARALQGQPVSLQGFMAPHLKVDSDFFILSNTPVETCPFCVSEGDWTDGIVFVRMRRRQPATAPGVLIVTEGRLEIGGATDAATGFVSRVRLADATFSRVTRPQQGD